MSLSSAGYGASVVIDSPSAPAARPPLPSGLWLYTYDELIAERRSQVRAAIMDYLASHNGIGRVSEISKATGIPSHVMGNLVLGWTAIRIITIKGRGQASWYCRFDHPVIPVKFLRKGGCQPQS